MPESDDALEANLGTLTDDEWLEGHRALIATGALPPEETRFLFDPTRPADDVGPDDLTEDGAPRG